MIAGPLYHGLGATAFLVMTIPAAGGLAILGVYRLIGGRALP